MKHLNIVKIFHSYPVTDVLKSLLTGLIFYLLIGGILVTPIITISYLYVPFMMYFLLAIYIVLSFTGSFGWAIFIKTLRNYNIDESIDYLVFKTRATVTLAAITFIVLAIVYIYLT